MLSSADEQALSGHAKWEASRFGTLESFILDFLVGGSSAGESVRLKLQTPLFVADALLEAAGQQLADDLAAAEQVAVLLAPHFLPKTPRSWWRGRALHTKKLREG